MKLESNIMDIKELSRDQLVVWLESHNVKPYDFRAIQPADLLKVIRFNIMTFEP